MDRTLKVKIALGVTLVFLAARLILGLFPVPLEFAPYSTEGKAATLQKVSFVEIQLVFSLVTDDNIPVYYYKVVQTDGSEGAVCSKVLYNNETFEEPVTFTGMITRVAPTEDLYDPAIVVIPEGGDPEAYKKMEGVSVLNRDYTQTTTDHPACFWVAAGGFISFCVMLAMLLKEYAGGKRKALPDEAE